MKLNLTPDERIDLLGLAAWTLLVFCVGLVIGSALPR
jgi:hypothetical protein